MTDAGGWPEAGAPELGAAEPEGVGVVLADAVGAAEALAAGVTVGVAAASER